MGICAYCDQDRKLTREHVWSDSILDIFISVAPKKFDFDRELLREAVCLLSCVKAFAVPLPFAAEPAHCPSAGALICPLFLRQRLAQRINGNRSMPLPIHTYFFSRHDYSPGPSRGRGNH